MHEIYSFQTVISYIHLVLVMIAAFQLRKQSNVDYISVFPWIMLIVYGHPVFGAVTFLIILSGILHARKTDLTKLNETAKRVFKLLLIFGVEFLLWFWLNRSGIYISRDTLWLIITSVCIGQGLILTHLLTTSSNAPKNKHGEQSMYSQFLVIVLELFLSLFVWFVFAATVALIPFGSWFYYLPPLWIFGLAAPLLSYRYQHLSVLNRQRDGLWRCSRSSITFCWGALAVLVPIVGPVICLLLYSFLLPKVPKRQISASKSKRTSSKYGNPNDRLLTNAQQSELKITEKRKQY